MKKYTRRGIISLDSVRRALRGVVGKVCGMPVIFSPTGALDADALAEEIEERFALYRQFGLVEEGCVRVGSRYHRCPSTGRIVDYVIRRRHELALKARQGFSDLEIGLGTAGKIYVDAVGQALKAQQRLSCPNYTWLKIAREEPIVNYSFYSDDPDWELLYLIGRQWYGRNEYYESQDFPGLSLAFVRPPDDRMARTSNGSNVEGRTNLGGGISPLDVYKKLKEEPYRYETPLTPEVALGRVLRLVANHQTVPHVFDAAAGTAALCARTVFRKDDGAFVPGLYWSKAECLQRLEPIKLTCAHPNCATPTMVDLFFIRG